MLGFNFGTIKQWVGEKAKNISQWVGDKAKQVGKVVKDIVDLPAKVIEAVKLYGELTANAIIKTGKPLLKGIEKLASFISDKAYDWFGNNRRSDKVTIDGKELTKLYDDQHAVAYTDNKYCYIAYRGTEPKFDITAKGSIDRTISDLVTDATAALGQVPADRTNKAMAFYNKVSGMTNKPIVLLTGHSLGGYLAKHVHFGTGKKIKTILFNAFEHPNQKNQQSSNLIIHRVFGDPVSTWSGVSSSKNNRHLYKMDYNLPDIKAHSLDLFL